MFDLSSFIEDSKRFESQEQFSKYLESCFVELENYLNGIGYDEFQKIKFDIEELLYDLIENKLIQKENSKIINAFLILLAQKLEQAMLIGAITIVYEYLPQTPAKKRLEAARLYLRVNDISKDYLKRSEQILLFLDEASQMDEFTTNSAKSFFYFVNSAVTQFDRVKNIDLAKSFLKNITILKPKYGFMGDENIESFLGGNSFDSFAQILEQIKFVLSSFSSVIECKLDTSIIKLEDSQYAKNIRSLPNVGFDAIRNVAYEYIKSLGDPDELYNRLQRGEAIIDDEKLLCKYLVSFGGKHKIKLYSAFDEIFSKIQNQKLNIIDWGCGQALATMLLLNYARDKNVVLDIEDIVLIEPSSLALGRGLLYIDVLKQKDYRIKSINSDLDCLADDSVSFDNNNKTIHLFSNILDIEYFKLDELLRKISKNLKNESVFVCVSPKRNDKLNSRLDLFFNYFDENFDTELISSRDDDINGATRYQKIFEVSPAKLQDIENSKNELKDYHVDIYSRLERQSDIVMPTLNPARIRESVESDPDYVIFKIRKVTEIITSRIYAKYESNEERISQNDKIRYLSHAKQVLNRKAQSHLHTIRTIGNIGTHQHIDNPINILKEDAYFLLTALVLLIEELKNSKLI